MKGLMRIIAWTGLMCASAAVFADSVTFNVGPSGDYETIQKAINAATANDIVTINVAVGEYNENITLRTDITLTLTGAETARTILKARDKAKPVIAASGVRNCQITRFTFTNSIIGIQLSNGSSMTIAGNVFDLGTGGTAVNATDTLDTSTITNNTFFQNKLAVSRAANSTTIQNNIFASNTTAISSTDKTVKIDHNLFTPVTAAGQMGSDTTILTASDPLFVDPADGDFHLRVDSAAIDKGAGSDTYINESPLTPADLGAYGGAYADPTPFPVQNVTIGDSTATAPDAFDVTASWTANASYLSGSYKLYYYFEGKAGAVPYNGTEATPPGVSGTNVGNVVSTRMSGTIPSTSGTVATPEFTSVTPQSQSLKLVWKPVDNATSYEVHYGVGTVGEQTVNVGNVTSHTLTGLQNGVTYQLAIAAVRQAILHVAIKVQDSTPVAHLSDYSAEATKALGTAAISSDSGILTGIPEEVVAFPALPNEGCFIATAAYGSYSAAQVKTLRDFRDRYLLTNVPGRAFVGWYYEHSPPAAHYLNQHPALKPVVRGLLLPFVFVTSVINEPAPGMPAAIFILLPGIAALGFYWRRRTSWA